MINKTIESKIKTEIMDFIEQYDPYVVTIVMGTILTEFFEAHYEMYFEEQKIIKSDPDI